MNKKWHMVCCMHSKSPPEHFQIDVGTGTGPLMKGWQARGLDNAVALYGVNWGIECSLAEFARAFDLTIGDTLRRLNVKPTGIDENPIDEKSPLWNEGIVASTDDQTVGMSLEPIIRNDWSRLNDANVSQIIGAPVTVCEWRFNTPVADVVFDQQALGSIGYRRIAILSSTRISEEIAGLCRRTCTRSDVTEYDLKRHLDDVLREFDPV